ncbi:MAG: YitT family protein [Bacteroidia bacterium]|nr:YitT family protein [Bacteroidia bacterium]MDW8345646.1 YitT family protein [Bacteroidia bacterium]
MKTNKKGFIADTIRSILYVGVGIFSASFGLKGFLAGSNFIDGGVTGISMLISILSQTSLSLWIFLLNIPFIFLGYKVISKDFAIRTGLAILGLSLVVGFVPFPIVTKDKLLIAIFGGFFLGAGIGFSVRGSAVIDGTEVLAVFLARRLHTTIGDIILVINVMIFSTAAYLLSTEDALYSMITYLAASKTLDFVVEGIEEYIGVMIISARSEEIRLMIIQEMRRGVTLYLGKQGYGSHGHRKEISIVYTVITRLELSKLKNEIDRIDPEAFVIISSVKDVKGGLVKKRPLKH